MHFALYVYKEIRSDFEICSKKLAIPLFNFGKQHITTNACKKLQLQLYIVVIVVWATMMGNECFMITIYIIYILYIKSALNFYYIYCYIYIYYYIYIYIYIYINIIVYIGNQTY